MPLDNLSYEDFGPSHADGFPWTCCDRPADAQPCKSGRHREAENAVEWDGLLYAGDDSEGSDESSEVLDEEDDEVDDDEEDDAE